MFASGPPRISDSLFALLHLLLVPLNYACEFSVALRHWVTETKEGCEL